MVIIIKLKQWTEVELVEGKEAIVRSAINSGMREAAYTSYQAWSYAALIENCDENVQTTGIQLKPCAYLHNYRKLTDQENPLTQNNYQYYMDLAPFCAKGDVDNLWAFIKKYIRKGDHKSILYQIELGRIRPSKSLKDALLNMLQGNEELIMIDEQKVMYEWALQLSREAIETDKKHVMIIEGGHGTKSQFLQSTCLLP